MSGSIKTKCLEIMLGINVPPVGESESRKSFDRRVPRSKMFGISISNNVMTGRYRNHNTYCVRNRF